MKKVSVVLPQGANFAEVVVREGSAIKVLDPKAPVKTKLSGVIGVPFEYLKKRLGASQFTQENSHLIVDREKIKITLIINESDEYTRGEISGALEFHPNFIAFGINTVKIWTPTELGLFLKINRVFFPDKDANMKLVTELMNFTATINSRLEKSVRETGDRTDHFAQTVQSNLPKSFTIEIPIFKGMPIGTLEVETFAKINGREVSFTLLSPGANQMLETIRDQVIDEQLTEISKIAPKLAIIEV
ncbi:MAG: hypothetical protein LBH60_00425 [Prevotellaceae bacterium]|nr:hypothetical protein [Prevotellaceae bacterium]